jgi:hypothetical protein
MKLLSALASLAAIILFTAVAVTSSATAAIIGGYGIFFTGLMLPGFLWALAYLEGIRSIRGWLVGVTATALMAGWVGRLVLRPSGYSADDFHGFGFFQILGVVGLIASAAVATFIVFRRYEDFYRACPRTASHG